ncbi:maleylpyruvate isomerase family mycothiol-dependent enzyme [Streptosporangium sp. NBC_01469]|uniref:maleylpyruvate isomerase family mycothiol-dependent enzyme n=1 Tax=Streptosporangium sp. NBC_01469 TaxID=2903898 RepID=UPI002E2C479A|nr:maleylpyruvate isomerase family mycothiol-dependent enzyme [Streptosporangium sp. NBC_01469]
MTGATEAEVRRAIAAERRDLADVLTGLPGRTWDEPTLCAGWRVREVVAHMTMPFHYSAARFMIGMLRARGNFNRMADRSARRDAASLSSGELAALLRDNADYAWKPPGGGFEGALTHEVIHGLDFTVPLGLDRRVPEDRLRIVLGGFEASKSLKFFGVDIRGIELRADDLDWSIGDGTPMYGAAQDLILVLCGRKLPEGRLRGEPSHRFVA